ncbi:regulatory LuxR family protein [Salana multivorans]|uniref:Regulatory LuxR family protein n=1 Tax=Salana multivorans TaxID=120377 RepID=A0A3N2DAM6_9MICO|nr:LuxR C-terminal-related transcriptional regulator [Salana multivorans]ROR96504.1 regulatory LuxR family protein [Salana multivorans]
MEALPKSGKLTALRQWAEHAPGRVLVEGRSLVHTRADFLSRTVWSAQAAARRQGHPVGPDVVDQGEPADYDELIVRLLAELDAYPWVTAIAFDGLVHAEPAAVVAGVQAVQEERPDLRVLFATIDGTPLVEAAHAAGLPVELVTDADVWFGPGETDRLARALLPEIDSRAVDALHRATDGHPGVTLALLETVPARVLAGDVTAVDAAQHWGARSLVDEDQGTSPLQEALRLLSPAPRFGLGLARRVTGNDDVAAAVTRLVATGVLDVEPGRRPGTSAYRWRFEVGRHFDDRVREIDDPSDDVVRRERLLEAALAEHDVALAVTVLVGLRRFAEAEAIAGDWFWEMVVSDDLELWRPLLMQPRERLAPYSALVSLATVLARRGGAASEADDRVLELGVRARLSAALRVVAGVAGAAGDEGAASSDATREAVPGGVDGVGGSGLAAELTQIAFAALECGDLGTAETACAQWYDLLRTSPVPLPASPSLVSQGLVVVQALIQLDQFDGARDVVVRLLASLDDEAAAAADPVGSRRVDLLRARMALDVLAGLPYDPFAGDAMDAVAVTRARQLDWVMRAWTKALVALDQGDVPAALGHTTEGMDAVGQPERWPVLVLLHGYAACATGDRPEILRLSSLLRSAAWRRRHGDGDDQRPVGAVVDAFVEGAIGGVRDAAGPASIAYARSCHRVAERRDPASPRLADHLLLVRAAHAVGAGREDVAAQALVAAAKLRSDQVGPGFAPLGLLCASPRQVDQLLTVAARVLPAHEVARLAQARQFAGAAGPVTEAVELSEREASLLQHIDGGLSNAQIAALLFVSVNTVKFHRANLYRKLRARTSGEALAVARRMGLVG